MKLICIFSLLFFTLTSCKAQQKDLLGSWKIISVKNIVHIDNEDVQDLKRSCIGNILVIGNNKISFKKNSQCDFNGCDTLELSPMNLKVIEDNSETLKYPGQEIYNGEVSKGFLKFIEYKNINTYVKAYDSKCAISWGDDSLKIIPLNNECAVLLLGSYIITILRV